MKTNGAYLSRKWLLRGLLIHCLCICTLLTADVFAKDEEPLTMGVFPRRNAVVTMTMFKPLAEYLSQQLGRQVRVVTAKDFPSFWESVEKNKYDIVHYNQLHYVISNQKFGYNVVAKNSEFGRDTIAGALVVRKDSGINHVADLKGKKIVFGGGKKALVSYVVTTLMLRRSGLEKGDYIEKFSKNPPNATLATYKNQADAAGVGDVALSIPLIKKKADLKQLKYLARSEQLPHLPWAVKGSLSLDLKLEIQNLLVNLKTSESGKKILQNARITNLSMAEDIDYDVIRDLIREFNEKN